MSSIQSSSLQDRVAAIRSLLKVKKLQEAQSTIGQLIRDHLDHALVWEVACEFSLAVNQAQHGLQQIRKAIKLAPDSLNPKIMEIHCLLRLEQVLNAKSLIQTLISVAPNNHLLLNEVANLCVRVNEFEWALSLYQRASDLQPNFYGYHYNIATTLRMLGRIEQSIRALERTLALNPNDFEAVQMRSSLQKQNAENNHLSFLKKSIVRTDLDDFAKMHLSYALAKELDDLQQYSESFRYLQQGSAIRRNAFNYKVSDDLSMLKEMEVCLNEQIFATSQSIDSKLGENAIFILGLPRTGSTLVERMLGNHDKVFAAGELKHFPMQLHNAVSALHKNKPLSAIDRVKRLADINFKETGEKYLHNISGWVGKQPYFIDKLPLNSIHLGALHLALPKAKIILLQRHPMDTCFAIYRNLFAGLYPFSYCLDELGQYYIAHNRLMEHWKKTLGHVIHTVKYEDVVHSPAAEISALLDYCKLDWQQACMEYEKNMAPSTTASAAQVREKLYSSSINKWKHYENELGGLIKQLQAAGIDCT